MERATVERWTETYGRLWRTSGTDLLAELFTTEASYQPSPWAPPLVGLDEIARF